MPTTSICGTVRGNRRSDNIPEGAGGSAEGNTPERRMASEPQISSQGLQFSGFAPIKPLPSIKEVVAQTRTLTEQTQAAVPTAQPDGNVAKPQETTASETVPEQPRPAEPEQEKPDIPQPELPQEQSETNLEVSPTAVEKTERPAEDFAECWKQMVDSIFQKKPAFYHQLYDYLPVYEQDVIKVDVENDFQKNQLEMSKRAMLEYWRNHFQLNVDEIEFVIHEHEKKKVIYTSEDKVENMLEQNPELKDFLQVLNFRIKD